MAKALAFRSSASPPYPRHALSSPSAPGRAHKKTDPTHRYLAGKSVSSPLGNLPFQSCLPLWQATAPMLAHVSSERSLVC